MQTHVSKWGNSLGVRIPSAIAEKIGITEGSSIELIIEDNHILIQKVFCLESLLAEITPDNIHSEISTGSSSGREVW